MKNGYQTIKGIGRSGFQVGLRSKLYQGTDHLLLVQSTGYTEEYKRIFFKNIRYIVARRTQGQIWQGLISGLLFAAICLLYLTSLPFGFTLALSLPFLIWFIINLARGTSCRVSVSTDIQTLDLPTPSRVGKIPVLINLLREKTEPPVTADTGPSSFPLS